MSIQTRQTVRSLETGQPQLEQQGESGVGVIATRFVIISSEQRRQREECWRSGSRAAPQTRQVAEPSLSGGANISKSPKSWSTTLRAHGAEERPVFGGS